MIVVRGGRTAWVRREEPETEQGAQANGAGFGRGRPAQVLSSAAERLLLLEPQPSVATGPGSQVELALARREILGRRQRNNVFGAHLFADPAWDLLLDLFVAMAEGRLVTIKSACLAASVPHTTGLRYIGHLVRLGLVVRRPHPTDSRSTLVQLTACGIEGMSDYFAKVRSD